MSKLQVKKPKTGDILHLVLLLTGLLMLSQYVQSAGQMHSITVHVTNLKSNKGQLVISVFSNQTQFKNEKPIKSYTVKKSNVKAGKLKTLITLPPGTYGIALLDDENSNKKMDYRGPFPLEGFGFGDYYHRGMMRPVFSDFSFTLSANKSLVAKMRYL